MSSDTPIDDAENGNVVAVFCHQQTLDAVTSSPSVVRMFLEKAGFSFSMQTDTVPEGHVLANNDDTRRDFRKRVAKALSNQALEKALHRVGTECDFDVRAFIQSIAKGKCGSTTQAAPETQSAAQPAPQPIKVVPATAPRRPRPVAKPITVRPAAKPIQMPDDPSEVVIPRRPSQLRGLGVKNRERPQ